MTPVTPAVGVRIDGTGSARGVWEVESRVSCRKETLEHEYHHDLSGRIQVTKERGRDKLSGPSSSSRVQ